MFFPTPLILELLGMGAGTPVVPPTPVPIPSVSPSSPPSSGGGGRWSGDKKWEQRYQPERDKKLKKIRDEEEEFLITILADEWP